MRSLGTGDFGIARYLQYNTLIAQLLMTEVPSTHEHLPAFQAFLREAIRYSCGDTLTTLIDDYPVTYGNSWKSNGDFQCFVASAIFSRTIGLQNKLLAEQALLSQSIHDQLKVDGDSQEDAAGSATVEMKLKKVKPDLTDPIITKGKNHICLFRLLSRRRERR